MTLLLLFCPALHVLPATAEPLACTCLLTATKKTYAPLHATLLFAPAPQLALPSCSVMQQLVQQEAAIKSMQAASADAVAELREKLAEQQQLAQQLEATLQACAALLPVS